MWCGFCKWRPLVITRSWRMPVRKWRRGWGNSAHDVRLGERRHSLWLVVVVMSLWLVALFCYDLLLLWLVLLIRHLAILDEKIVTIWSPLQCWKRKTIRAMFRWTFSWKLVESGIPCRTDWIPVLIDASSLDINWTELEIEMNSRTTSCQIFQKPEIWSRNPKPMNVE